jgi:hypothetical protein
MAISSMLGCIAVVTLWGFGGQVGLPLLAPFAIVFGLAAGGFSSMWSQSAHALAGPNKELQTLLVAGEFRRFRNRYAMCVTTNRSWHCRMVHRSRTWCHCRTDYRRDSLPSNTNRWYEKLGFRWITWARFPRCCVARCERRCRDSRCPDSGCGGVMAPVIGAFERAAFFFE